MNCNFTAFVLGCSKVTTKYHDIFPYLVFEICSQIFFTQKCVNCDGTILWQNCINHKKQQKWLTTENRRLMFQYSLIWSWYFYKHWKVLQCCGLPRTTKYSDILSRWPVGCHYMEAFHVLSSALPCTTSPTWTIIWPSFSFSSNHIFSTIETLFAEVVISLVLTACRRCVKWFPDNFLRPREKCTVAFPHFILY